jgi:metallo-beta-lactamase class B
MWQNLRVKGHNTMRQALALVLVLTGTTVISAAGQAPRMGSQPVDPYKVIGNIYYVGSIDVSSHIIVTKQGLILIDTGTKEMVPIVQSSIQKLGHRLSDVKIILSSHAHWDHVEGHAAMKQATGARIMALGEDAASISSGKDTSAANAGGWTPAKVDRVLKDGDTVTLGEVTLRAYLTPGHTKGCTTWMTDVMDGGRSYAVVFVGGTSINQGVRLVGNTRHPGIIDDYAKTFRVLKELRPDVFLAQHGRMYGMEEKMQRMKTGTGNPFVDPEGYRKFVAAQEAAYLKQLAEERGGSK